MLKRYEDELAYWHKLFRGENRSEWLKNLLDPDERWRCVPDVVQAALALYRERFPDRQPLVLDVGAGPISCLKWLADTGRVDLISVDPLAHLYDELLIAHGCGHEGTLPEEGESLESKLPAASFDLVFMRNALDHSQAPGLVVRSILKVLKDGGLFVLQSKAKEGTAAGWGGCHAWDLWLDGKTLMLSGRNGIGAGDLLAGLPFVPEADFIRDGGEWFSGVWAKKPL